MPPSIHPPGPASIRRKLRSWYRKNARDLPWRRTRNAYEILVSELMLQQTQVSRVITRYGDFLASFRRWPTLPRRNGASDGGMGRPGLLRQRRGTSTSSLPRSPTKGASQAGNFRRISRASAACPGSVPTRPALWHRLPMSAGPRSSIRMSPACQARVRPASCRENHEGSTHRVGSSPRPCCRGRVGRRGPIIRRSWSLERWSARRELLTVIAVQSGLSAGQQRN